MLGKFKLVRNPEHRTVDTGERAPYPNMTADDLHDFEVWAEEIMRNTWIGRLSLWLDKFRKK